MNRQESLCFAIPGRWCALSRTVVAFLWRQAFSLAATRIAPQVKAVQLFSETALVCDQSFFLGVACSYSSKAGEELGGRWN